MKAYEDQLYVQWREGVEHMLPGLLRRNLLVRPPTKDGLSVPVGEEEDEAKIKEAGTLIVE